MSTQPPTKPRRVKGRLALLLGAQARAWLDDWFNTAARYCGLGLGIYAVVIDRFRNPALLPFATSLIFLKNVRGSKSGNGDKGE